MATITDVAERAGVSRTTVSRHLRGHRVRAAEAIRDAIAALEFEPNPVARSLKSGMTRAIGIVVPDVTNPYFAAVVKGIETVARQERYRMYLANTDESVERENEVLAGLAGLVDGLILAPATEQDKTPLALRRAGIPVVFIDREIEGGAGFDSVLVDNAGGAAAAVQHLVSLGHERIGFMSGPRDTTPGRGRYEGFQAALLAAGLEPEPGLLHDGDFRQESGYQGALRLLALERPPTAIFTANNLMSIGALRAFHDMGVRLPDDLSFVGFDDLDLGELLAPPLTVVDRPTEEQGALAARLLLNRLGGRAGAGPSRVVLQTRLLVRGSSAAPATRGCVVPISGVGK